MLFDMFEEDQDYEEYSIRFYNITNNEINNEINEYYKKLDEMNMQISKNKEISQNEEISQNGDISQNIEIIKHNGKNVRVFKTKKKRICIHNRHINACKKCGGSSICKHNRFGYSCKDCYKSRIREGKKSAYCKHLYNKTLCKKCNKK